MKTMKFHMMELDPGEMLQDESTFVRITIFHVHNWLIISLKDFCIVIRKWPTFWPSNLGLCLSDK